jgi:hypothetical protein
MTDRLSAFHEAGHAVISLLLGELADSASIRAEGDSLGHTRYLSVEARAIAEAAVRGSTQADRDRVMAYLVGTAAGPAAQALHMRGTRIDFLDQASWETFGGSRDYQQAERVIGKARSLLVADMDDVASEAFDLLEQPGIWSAVKHVADDLLRFGELDYEGIQSWAGSPTSMTRRRPTWCSRAALYRHYRGFGGTTGVNPHDEVIGRDAGLCNRVTIPRALV